jgi:glycoside/pentoside/hexuronide:cation symporter, GPH family
LAGTGGMLSSILSIPMFTYLARRYGKLKALYINVGLMLVGSVAKWFLITPANPYLMIVNGIMMGPGTTGLWVILASMSADICDYDEVKTGKRREGSFSSIYQWILKLGSSLAFLMAGFILVGTGFDVELGGEQAASTFFWMRVFYTATPATAMLIIFAILTRYPLTERETQRIRKELEERRGEL